MSATLLAFGRAVNEQFAKASMLSKLAMVFNMALAYFVLILYSEGLKQNQKIIDCHEARVKDQRELFNEIQGVNQKVQKNDREIKKNSKELEEIKTNNIGHNDSYKRISNPSSKSWLLQGSNRWRLWTSNLERFLQVSVSSTN